MPEFTAEVVVSLKPVVNDPQGLVVRDGLHHLGFDSVSQVRVGKHIVLTLSAADAGAAGASVASMAEKLLCNPVIEEYAVTLTEAQTTA